MSRRLWKHRITDILESIKKIQNYVDDMEFDDFQKDEKTIDAVIRNFIVIGEAARHVPDDISSKYGAVNKAEDGLFRMALKSCSKLQSSLNFDAT